MPLEHWGGPLSSLLSFISLFVHVSVHPSILQTLSEWDFREDPDVTPAYK